MLRITMKQLKSVSLAALLAVLGASASANVITTTFASNNNFAGNMFDLQVGANSLLITGIDVNLDNAGSTNNMISVYTRMGTYSGFESNAAGWFLQDTVTVTSAGSNNATLVDLSDFVLDAGELYGVYVTLSNYSQSGSHMLYTNGANTYANGDLSLTLGIGKGDPDFTGGNFLPRTWNGSIYYDIQAVPEPGSLALVGLALLGGLTASRRLRPQSSPAN